MGRKRNTFVKVTISSPEKFVEVKDPTLQFEKEAEELISKMAKEPK